MLRGEMQGHLIAFDGTSHLAVTQKKKKKREVARGPDRLRRRGRGATGIRKRESL